MAAVQTSAPTRLLLLSPSAGMGGGIERVMDAVETTWPGPIQRLDLVRSSQNHPSGQRSVDGRVSRGEIVRFARRGLHAAHTFRPDVVVCGLLGLLPLASPLAVITRSKLALFAYGVDVWGPLGPIERLLIRRQARLLAISSFTATVVAARAGVDPRKIRVVSLPLAEGIAAAAHAPVDDHSFRQPIVLTVSRIARIDRFKGHFDIARCFGRVLEQRPDARWYVVGDGDGLPALHAECTHLGIQDAVTFTGRISDEELIMLYRRAAVFVLPSFADADADPPVGEGFGLVYAEAGAFGLPIIAATHGGGSTDFVIDGETGLTVRPHALDELGGRIVQLLDNADLRDALGQRARARSLARHLPMHFQDALQHALR